MDKVGSDVDGDVKNACVVAEVCCVDAVDGADIFLCR